MDFYNTYLRKCLEKGVSPSKAAVEAGTTKTAVSRWKSGSIPSDATLLKLADYFGCTIEELKGITTEKPATGEGDGDKNNVDILRTEVNELIDSLEPSDRALLLAFGRRLKDAQGNRQTESR